MGTDATQQATRIAMEYDRYGENLKSKQEINVTGLSWGYGDIRVCPAGAEARQEQGGPMIPGPWAYTITYAMVIDNNGGSAVGQRKALQIEKGATVKVDGLPGLWTIEARDARKFEGDGFKLVPADDAARANEARCKAQGELGSMEKIIDKAAVSSVRWRAERAAKAIAELGAAGGDAGALRSQLAVLTALAAAAGKAV